MFTMAPFFLWRIFVWNVNFKILDLIMHIIIHFLIYWGQIVIICTKNGSQRVLIGFFPNRKMQFLVWREGQRPITKLSRCPKRPISWTSNLSAFRFHAPMIFWIFYELISQSWKSLRKNSVAELFMIFMKCIYCTERLIYCSVIEKEYSL